MMVCHNGKTDELNFKIVCDRELLLLAQQFSVTIFFYESVGFPLKVKSFFRRASTKYHVSY